MKKATAKLLPSFPISSYSKLFLIPSSCFSSSSPSQPTSESSSSSSAFITNYLTETFNWPKETVLKASQTLHHIKTPENPDAVIELLQTSGLSKTQVSKLVLRRPLILNSKLKTNLLPKIKLFQSIGVSGSLLGNLIISTMGTNLDRRLAPSITFLRSILQNDKNIRLALYKHPSILCKDPETTPTRNVEFLRRKGIDPSSLSSLVLGFPVVLLLSREELFVAYKTIEELGCKDFLYLVSYKGTQKYTSRLKVLKIFGFGGSCSVVLSRWSPLFFRLDRGKLKRKLEFFLKEVGLSSATLMKYPYLFGFSLGKRLIPRYIILQILQSKGLQVRREVDYLEAFLMPKVSFVDRYVHKFEDQPALGSIIDYWESESRIKEQDLREQILVLGGSENFIRKFQREADELDEGCKDDWRKRELTLDDSDLKAMACFSFDLSQGNLESSMVPSSTWKE